MADETAESRRAARPNGPPHGGAQYASWRRRRAPRGAPARLRSAGRFPRWAYVVIIPLLGFAAGLLFRAGADRHDAYLQMYATIGVAVVGLLTARAFAKWQVDQAETTIADELDLLRAGGFRVRPIRWGPSNSADRRGGARTRRLIRSDRRRERLLRKPPSAWVLYRDLDEVGYYVMPDSLPHNAGRRKAARLLGAAAARTERDASVLTAEMRARNAPWDKWADNEGGTLPDRLVPCLLLLRRRPRPHEVGEMTERGIKLLSPETLISELGRN